MAPIPAQIPLLPNRGGRRKGKVLSLSLSRVVNTRPASPISLHRCIMTTFLPRQRHIRGAGRWKQRRPSFPAARRLPPHLSSLFSHSIIFMRMHVPKIRSFSSTRLLLYRRMRAQPSCVRSISLSSCNLPKCYTGHLFSFPELQINK